MHGGEKRLYRLLVGKPEGKRPLRRPRRRWENHIKMYLQKWDVGVSTGSAESEYGQVSGTCEWGNEPSGSIKCGEFLA
jgi:hypothetical protein